MYIDQSVYSDIDPPSELLTLEAKADYLHRICSAWDFRIHPEPETFAVLREWKQVFDRFPLVTSPAYHAFRAWFGWERVPRPAGLAYAEPAYVTWTALREEATPANT
jgi:hypothetical protein